MVSVVVSAFSRAQLNYDQHNASHQITSDIVFPFVPTGLTFGVRTGTDREAGSGSVRSQASQEGIPPRTQSTCPGVKVFKLVGGDERATVTLIEGRSCFTAALAVFSAVFSV
jgi:hypothetical protein